MVSSCKDMADRFDGTNFGEISVAKKKSAKPIQNDPEPTVNSPSLYFSAEDLREIVDILKDCTAHLLDAAKQMDDLNVPAILVKGKKLKQEYAGAIAEFGRDCYTAVVGKSAALRMGSKTAKEKNRERYLKYGKKKADAN